MLEVNKALESGHFQNNGVVQTSMNFWKALAIGRHVNKIVVKLGQNGKHKRTSKLPIYVPCEKITVKHYGGMWDTSKKIKSEIEISKAALSELFEMW